MTRMQKQYYAARGAGLCVTCRRNPNLPRRVQCETCRTRTRAWNRQRDAAKARKFQCRNCSIPGHFVKTCDRPGVFRPWLRTPSCLVKQRTGKLCLSCHGLKVLNRRAAGSRRGDAQL